MDGNSGSGLGKIKQLTPPKFVWPRAIEHKNVAYSDDKDRHVLAEHSSEVPMESVIEKMRESAKKWDNLVMISGGSLVLHKTSWRLLAWEMEK